jgi:hypothetical protein
VATARKLAILFWCMLTRGEGYAHQQPSLTKKKLRRLELTAGAPKHAKTARGIWSSNQAIRQAERQLAQQAEASYKRLIQDQQARAPARKVGASATPERAYIEALDGAKPRGRLKAPDVCASLRQSPAPTRQPNPTRPRQQAVRTRLPRNTAEDMRTGASAGAGTTSEMNASHRSAQSTRARKRPSAKPLTFIGRAKRECGSLPLSSPARVAVLMQSLATDKRRSAPACCINLDNILDAPAGLAPGHWPGAAALVAAGFRTVRVPACSMDHVGGDGRGDPVFADRATRSSTSCSATAWRSCSTATTSKPCAPTRPAGRPS